VIRKFFSGVKISCIKRSDTKGSDCGSEVNETRGEEINEEHGSTQVNEINEERVFAQQLMKLLRNRLR
jgi:hypothetical protein